MKKIRKRAEKEKSIVVTIQAPVKNIVEKKIRKTIEGLGYKYDGEGYCFKTMERELFFWKKD